MIDIESLSHALRLGDDAIWRSVEEQQIYYPSEGNKHCFAVEENSFWFQHRNNCIVSAVATFPPLDNGPIFDIGGGNGFVALGLLNAGFETVLVEPGNIGACNAKKRGIEHVICATTDSAKFVDNSLPAVSLFDVIEHIDDDVQFLKAIRKLVKNGGTLYATVPAYNMLWSDDDIIAGHFRRHTLKSISQVLDSAGFSTVYSSYFFRFLPLPILFVRTIPHRFGIVREQNLKKLQADHKSPEGILKRMVEMGFPGEISNIENKISMGFGGSCLIVATAS